MGLFYVGNWSGWHLGPHSLDQHILLPSETYRKKWSDSNFHIIFTELSVPQLAEGVIGTLKDFTEGIYNN